MINQSLVFDTPILLLAWRRPEALSKVIDAIKPSRPTKLFVACDGPNKSRQDEAEKVAKVRLVIKNKIDWDCSIKYRYSTTNQGCKIGVSRALDWFFENVDEGIVLEDDCIPHPDFLSYCRSLLERYRHDTRVWSISGTNFQSGRKYGGASYYFSRYATVWGWATWRRCWSTYDVDLVSLARFRRHHSSQYVFNSTIERIYWHSIWERLRHTSIPDTWDYQWMYTCFSNGGLTVVPNSNLISNIGSGDDATHTTRLITTRYEQESFAFLTHPEFILPSLDADKYFFSNKVFTISQLGGLLLRKVSRKCLSWISKLSLV